MLEKFEKLVKLATDAGFDKAEVYATAQSSFSVSVFEGQIEDYRVEKSAGIALRGLYGGQMGYASTQVDDENEYADLVRRAKENAQVLESQDEQFLYDGKEALPWVSSFNPALEDVPPERKIALAMEMERACKALDSRVVRVAASEVGTTSQSCVLVNSEGLRRTFQENLAYAIVEPVLSVDGGQVDGTAFRFTRSFDELDAQALAKEAVEDAVRYIGASSVPSGTMPVVLERRAMQSLLNTFASVFTAEAAQRGLSLLAGKEGEEIASPLVTLVDDPSDGLGLAGRPFDGEGVPTRRKAVIERGVLRTLLYTLKTAKKAGKETTGNASRPSYLSTVGTAPTNFYIEPGDLSPEALCARAGDGVRIDQIMGMHAGANQISGDFSLAAKGMRIEDGKLAGPVEQITVSGNFFKLLKGIAAVGDDLWFGFPGSCAVGAPSVLVEGLSIAGK
jgi:PmbA protein